MCGVWLYVFLKRHILHQQSVGGHSLTFHLCPKVGQLGQTWRQTSQTVMSTVCTANAPWTPTIGISSPAAYIWTVTIHCRLMSPGSLALITENPCQHQPHPWVPQNSPVSPETVWQPELSMSNTPPPSCTTRRVICRENRRRILILSHNMNKHWVFCGRSINQTDSPNVWKDSPGNRLSSSSARNSLIPGLDQVLLYNSLW